MTEGWAQPPDFPGDFPVRFPSDFPSDKPVELGRQASDRKGAPLSLRVCALRADVRRGQKPKCGLHSVR